MSPLLFFENKKGAFAFLPFFLSLLCSTATHAESSFVLKPRIEANMRAGTERSILMTEAWMPLAQTHDSVLYGDARLMGDDGDNREWNLGLGYRDLTGGGQSVMGVHGWLDRRRSERGSVFHQVAGGVEYLSQGLDIRLNGYIPFNEKETYTIDSGGVDDPYLADTGIFYDADGQLVEKPLHGMDLELSIPVSFLEDKIESFRVSAGGFIFDDSDAETLRGARLRARADITPDLSLGARFETDNQRGSQGFAEITVRFPFGSKASQKTLGLRGRLDESPERDIDVVAASQIAVEPTRGNPVLNASSGQAQRVFHVDNTAAPGGDGSLDNPFNTLADANAAANRAGDVIYINRGDGTTTGMDQGVTVSSAGQSVIGSGSAFVYDGGRFTTSTGQSFSGFVLRTAGTAPTLSNINPNSDGITVAAADILISGITIDGAARHGIYAAASGGDDLGTLTLQNVTLRNNTDDGLHVAASGAGSIIDAALTNVRAEGNHNGIRYYAASDAAVTGMMESSVATANTQHGVIIYDDSTAGSVDVDLGGGARSSGLNGLYSNTLEDLAVELDGATLMAQNNWWGQASGPDTDSPATGIAPQIWFGAPVDNSNLVGHWTIDTEWVSGSTIYDRSRQGNNGTVGNGLSLADQVAGHNGEALNFDGVDDLINLAGVHLSPFSGDLTIASWIRTSNVAKTEMTILGEWTGTLGRDYQLYLRNGLVRFHHANAAGTVSEVISSGLNVADGNFHHVAFTADFPTYTFYVDGAPLVSGAMAFDIAVAPGTAVRRISGTASFPSTIWDGDIDDVSLYKRALSPTEIAESYRMDSTSVVDTSGFLTAAP